MELGSSKWFISIVFVVLVSSIIAASGSNTKFEREYVKVNGFNVSFQLNQTHDFKVDQGNGINGSVTIRTFDGSMTVDIYRYPTPRSMNSTWVNEGIAREQELKLPSETIEVDKSQGYYLIYNNNGYPMFIVFYIPDLINGKTNTGVTIVSNLPLYETADLLRTIHVVEMG